MREGRLSTGVVGEKKRIQAPSATSQGVAVSLWTAECTAPITLGVVLDSVDKDGVREQRAME